MDSKEYAKKVKASLDLARVSGEDEIQALATALDEYTKMKVREWKTRNTDT